MPSRNIVKEYGEDCYYHVYSRGANKQKIFLDDDDFRMFISLFKRYLSRDPQASPSRTAYPHYYGRVRLLSYCLMPNHIHLMLHQRDKTGLSDFMRSVMTSYSMYFNRKYKHHGPVFQSRFLASHIDDQTYFDHVSRYIHMNPKDWVEYPYSSLPHYKSFACPEWLSPDEVLLQAGGIEEYLKFLDDYQEHKEDLDDIKWLLADNPDE